MWSVHTQLTHHHPTAFDRPACADGSMKTSACLRPKELPRSLRDLTREAIWKVGPVL